LLGGLELDCIGPIFGLGGAVSPGAADDPEVVEAVGASGDADADGVQQEAILVFAEQGDRFFVALDPGHGVEFPRCRSQFDPQSSAGGLLKGYGIFDHTAPAEVFAFEGAECEEGYPAEGPEAGEDPAEVVVSGSDAQDPSDDPDDDGDDGDGEEEQEGSTGGEVLPEPLEEEVAQRHDDGEGDEECDECHEEGEGDDTADEQEEHLEEDADGAADAVADPGSRRPDLCGNVLGAMFQFLSQLLHAGFHVWGQLLRFVFQSA